MKITGKIITIFLVLATLVFLVACNSGNDPISVESTVPETTKGRTDKEETTPEKIPESSTPAVSTAPTPSTTAPESETQPDTSNKVSKYDVSENGDGSLTATFTPNEDGQTYTLEFKGSGNMCSFLEDLQLYQ